MSAGKRSAVVVRESVNPHYVRMRAHKVWVLSKRLSEMCVSCELCLAAVVGEL